MNWLWANATSNFPIRCRKTGISYWVTIGIDIGRELLRRSHVLIVCGDEVDESVKNDIAVAQRLGITATTLDGILKIHAQGENEVEG